MPQSDFSKRRRSSLRPMQRRRARVHTMRCGRVLPPISAMSRNTPRLTPSCFEAASGATMRWRTLWKRRVRASRHASAKASGSTKETPRGGSSSVDGSDLSRRRASRGPKSGASRGNASLRSRRARFFSVISSRAAHIPSENPQRPASVGSMHFKRSVSTPMKRVYTMCGRGLIGAFVVFLAFSVHADDPLRALLAAKTSESLSLGGPLDGSLERSVPFPDRGPGFRKTSRRPEARYGTVEVVRGVVRAAMKVEELHPGGELLVNDLSLERGGPINRHESHRSEERRVGKECRSR